MATGWRYLAFRLNGDGTETPLSYDVPLQEAELLDELSGPGGIQGFIAPELERLKAADGDPMFRPWSTAIYAEKDGHIRAGAILADMPEDGPKLGLDCVGWTGYLQGQPYTGDLSRIQVDPLEMARHLWQHKQATKHGNVGLQLDSTTSKVRVGTEEKDVKFETGAGEDVEFKTGPYLLNWWQTHDMGKEFDDLALNTPFDYRVDHEWDGERVVHRLRLGYPTLGRRRTDRFMVGENVRQVPGVDYFGNEYASEVIVLGAGEGRKMIRGPVVNAKPGRLHRAKVVQDKSITSKAAARAAAERELARSLGEADISEIEVPLGPVQPGDEILITSPKGWTRDLNLWVRVLAVRTKPATNRSVLSVARVEKVD